MVAWALTFHKTFSPPVFSCLRLPFLLLTHSYHYNRREIKNNRMISFWWTTRWMRTCRHLLKDNRLLRQKVRILSLNNSIKILEKQLLLLSKISQRNKPSNRGQPTLTSSKAKPVSTTTTKQPLTPAATATAPIWPSFRNSLKSPNNLKTLPVMSKWFKVRSRTLTCTLMIYSPKRTKRPLWLLCRISQKSRWTLLRLITLISCKARIPKATLGLTIRETDRLLWILFRIFRKRRQSLWAMIDQ